MYHKLVTKSDFRYNTFKTMSKLTFLYKKNDGLTQLPPGEIQNISWLFSWAFIKNFANTLFIAIKTRVQILNDKLVVNISKMHSIYNVLKFHAAVLPKG